MRAATWQQMNKQLRARDRVVFNAGLADPVHESQVREAAKWFTYRTWLRRYRNFVLGQAVTFRHDAHVVVGWAGPHHFNLQNRHGVSLREVVWREELLPVMLPAPPKLLALPAPKIAGLLPAPAPQQNITPLRVLDRLVGEFVTIPRPWLLPMEMGKKNLPISFITVKVMESLGGGKFAGLIWLEHTKTCVPKPGGEVIFHERDVVKPDGLRLDTNRHVPAPAGEKAA